MMVDPSTEAEPVTMPTPVVHDRPRRFARLPADVLLEAVLSVTAGLAGALLLRAVLNWQGFMSTAVVWYLVSMAILSVLIRGSRGGLAAPPPRAPPRGGAGGGGPAPDRLATTVVWSVGVLACALLAWLLSFVVIKGIGQLSFSFFVEDLGTTAALDEGGGMRHALIGTLQQVGIATIISVPIAVMTAVYLNEVRGRMSPVVRFIIDAMSGLPSVVAGLLVFTLWILALGQGFSGFACSLALVVLMLPTVTRTSEEILRTVPGHLREASLALGGSRWRTVSRVVLPTARAGLLTAVILGIARATGETAPAILTTFGSSTTNTNPFSEPQANLPLTVFQLIRSGNQAQLERAYAGAFVLILLVLVAFAAARIISTRSERRLGKR